MVQIADRSAQAYDPRVSTQPQARKWRRSLDEMPHTSAVARMHPFTLRFDEHLEHEFISEYFDRTVGHVRVALVLATFLYTVFGVLDLFIAPLQRVELWIIRFAIAVPTLVTCLAFTYSPHFKRWREATLFVVILIAGLGIVRMTSIIPPPGSYLYYAGLLLAIMFVFTLLRLNVLYSTIVSSVIVVAYVGVAVWLNPTAPALVVNNLFFLLSTMIIGFMANYTMERYARTNFLQRRLIQRRTTELEEKNTELLAKNRMLAESRAANLKTARRSELMFSALSEALPGTVLDDKYRVAEKIGSGNFGTVYRGEHIMLHHPVAIKVFRPAVGTAALESLDRFRLEGISACRINHPNAVTVLDFDVSSGSLAYLVMELLEGHSLSDELRTGKKLAPLRCTHIAAAVCDVLAQAHDAGIVHRDIKPSNVFLHKAKHTGEELVKVIDFGIAKLTDDIVDGDQRSTITGMLVGSPAYMAPERLYGDPYDGRADVYAVGVMMYEALAGRLPYVTSQKGYWSPAMMHTKDADPPSTHEPGIPASVDAVILRAMARDPQDRPTASQLAADLRDCARQLS